MTQTIGQAATAESVFTPEYWTPYKEGQPLPNGGTIGWGTKRWTSSLCAQAATNIFLGEEQLALPPGTNLGGEATRDITYPGALYLVDLEMLLPSSQHPAEKYDNPPDWLSPHMRHPTDVAETAEVLFRYNAEDARGDDQDNFLPFTTAYPYDKSLINLESGHSYRRYVGLLIFANDYLDRAQGFFIREWDAHGINQVQGKALKGVSRNLGYAALSIGDNYMVAEDYFMRLRSASKCPVEYDARSMPKTPASQRF